MRLTRNPFVLRLLAGAAFVGVMPAGASAQQVQGLPQCIQQGNLTDNHAIQVGAMGSSITGITSYPFRSEYVWGSDAWVSAEGFEKLENPGNIVMLVVDGSIDPAAGEISYREATAMITGFEVVDRSGTADGLLTIGVPVDGEDLTSDNLRALDAQGAVFGAQIKASILNYSDLASDPAYAGKLKTIAAEKLIDRAKAAGTVTLEWKGYSGSEIVTALSFADNDFTVAEAKMLEAANVLKKAAGEFQCNPIAPPQNNAGVGPVPCFLTTAACEHVGLADDCWELEMLRAFRDGPLAKMPGGKADIERYYRLAPTIVQKINQRPDARRIWLGVYWREILPAAIKSRLGLNRSARRHYTAMVRRMQRFIDV